MQTAEYAKAIRIDHEPAFNWSVTHVLQKRERIISLVRKRETRYVKRTHRYGIEVPKTVKQAYELDRINGNTPQNAQDKFAEKTLGPLHRTGGIYPLMHSKRHIRDQWRDPRDHHDWTNGRYQP